MAIFVKLLKPDEEQALQNWSKLYDPNSLAYKRLQALLLSQHRIKTREIARRLDLMPTTVLGWIKRANREGLGEWLQAGAYLSSETAYSEGEEVSTNTHRQNEVLPQFQATQTTSDEINLERYPAIARLGRRNLPPLLFARQLSNEDEKRVQRLTSLYEERPQLLQRLEAIRLSSQGFTASEIAPIIEYSDETVRLWINKFNREGIEGLVSKLDKKWLINHQQANKLVIDK